MNPATEPISPNGAMTTCRVTYGMTDPMGFVHHGHFLDLFEMGRLELIRSSGSSYRDMEADGIALPVIHASCDYLAPARFDDLLEIATWIVKLTRARIHFEYEVQRQGEGEPLARGRTHHAYLSPQGRARRVSPQWYDRLERIAKSTRPPAISRKDHDR